MKIELKMDYNDVKVLRELATLGIASGKKHSDTRDDYTMAFKWDMTKQIFWIQVTNSYVINVVEFGKKYYPKFIVDDVVKSKDFISGLPSNVSYDENIYCVAVSPKHLLHVTRQILKHKKTTVDDTCKLILESAEPNVVRDLEDTEYKTMDNLYFDFEFDDDEYLNLFKLPPRTQRQDVRMIESIDNVMDNFIKDLTKRTKLSGTEYLNMTPDILFIDVELYSQATKIMNMNNDMPTTKMRYVKNNLYLWKHCTGNTDNVKTKEAIVMLRLDHSVNDDEILGKYRTKAETVIG